MRDEVLWLVKSSGRILGPFSASQVGELLKTREVSLLDEVSSPGRRWMTVQYHDSFRDIVDAVRKTSLSDKTEGNWTPTTNAGMTMTLTDVVDGDLTEEITGYSNTQKEIVIHNVHEQAQSVPVSLGSGRYQAPGAQNVAVQKQVEKRTRGLWIITVIILLVTGFFAFQNRAGKTPLAPVQGFESVKQEVIAEFQAGNQTGALQKLKSHFRDDYSSVGELSIYYGSLLIQLENPAPGGRVLLNNVISMKRPEIKQAYTSLGIADLTDGMHDAAKENFNKALAIDPSYSPAQLNLASVYLEKADYENARRIASVTLQASPRQAEAILILAEAELYLAKNGRGGSGLQSVAKAIRDYRAVGWDYAPELDFYLLYLDYLRGDKNMEERITAFLDQDPQVTADHRHSIFIYRSHFKWGMLTSLCEQMAPKLGDQARVATLLAACYSFNKQWEMASKHIEKAVTQSPKDALIQAWNAYILKESGNAEEASVVFGRASEFNRRGEFVLPNILQARFNQELGDIDGAEASWKKVRDHNVNSLPAIAGLAWVLVQNKAFGEAVKYIDQGLAISSDYVPLLKLKLKAEREGWYVTK